MSEQMNEAENKLREKIRSLDQQPPAMGWDQEDLWNEIQRKQQKKSPRVWISVAASISLLIVAAVFLYQRTPQVAELSYAFEQTTPVEVMEEDLSWMEAEALDFIESNCLEALVVCDKPEFKALKADLESLQSDIDQIDEMIEKYGEDPVIIKSRVQIEDLKNEITNKLVQMVLS